MYAQWIKRELERTGRSQVDLAPAMGIDPVKLSKSLNGTRRLQPAEIEGAAAFFGVKAPGNALGKPLVASFDPDADDPEGLGMDVPAAADERTFPRDAIKELKAPGGMGGGGTIQTSYIRDGVEILQRDEIKDDYWRFPSDVLTTLGSSPSSLIAIECQGDSMQPTLAPGERVWANTNHIRPSPDGLYAIRDLLGEIVVKRLHVIGGTPPKVQILSDNPAQPMREQFLDDIVVIGKVVAGLKFF